MPYLEQVHVDLADEGFVILAINAGGEDAGTVGNFMWRYKLTFLALLDEDVGVGAPYNAMFLPLSYLIDKNGMIQGIKAGGFQNAAEIEQAVVRLLR